MENFVLPPEFGLVILVTIASIFTVMWMSFQVGSARKRFEVPYPKMYSDDDRFNCYQRAHQNTLEGYPVFIVLIVFGGLYAPRLSAIAGLVWIAGRIAYAKGYYSGDPQKRLKGSFGYLGLLVLLGCSIIAALNLLGITNL